MADDTKDPEKEKPKEAPIEEEPVQTPDDTHFPLLRDVHGSIKFKKDLEEIMCNIQYPGVFNIMGIDPEKTFLFVGPPGTGKTFSVKALRNEILARGHNVSYLPYSIGTYGTAYINMGAVNLQKYFDEGRNSAAKGNIAIYWIDEADVLLRPRGEFGSHKEDDKLLDTLMTNLNDIHVYGENQYVFMATNFEKGIDQAAKRAGRIDRMVRFELPGKEQIAQAYAGAIARIHKKSKYNVFKNINTEELAMRSPEFNYADIDTVVDLSVRRKIFDIDFEGEVAKAPHVYNKDLLETLAVYMSQRTTDKLKAPIGFKR